MGRSEQYVDYRPKIARVEVEGYLPKLEIDLSGIKNLKVMPNAPDARQFLVATRILLIIY